MTDLCDDAQLQDLISAIQTSDDDLVMIDRLMAAYPLDPRLHFLRGSVLAGIGRSIEALAELKQAVALAPDFAIARFQLGFFLLTSGEVADALSSWGPLTLLDDGHYLRSFVGGLTHLIRDDFGEATRRIEEGIAANEENPPLNRDMQLILDRIAAIADETAEITDPDFPETSATSFFLGQASRPDRSN